MSQGRLLKSACNHKWIGTLTSSLALLSHSRPTFSALVEAFRQPLELSRSCSLVPVRFKTSLLASFTWWSHYHAIAVATWHDGEMVEQVVQSLTGVSTGDLYNRGSNCFRKGRQSNNPFSDCQSNNSFRKLAQDFTMYFPSYVALLSLCSSIVLSSPLALVKRATPPSSTPYSPVSMDTRAQHSAKALTWDTTLANTARNAVSQCNGKHIVRNIRTLSDPH